MRIVLAVLLALHGFAHLPGFVHGWRLRELDGLPFTDRILYDSVWIGRMGMQLLGTAWLFIGLAFVPAAAAVASGRPGWTLIVAGVAFASLLLCTLGLPQARIGLFLNLGILVALGVATKLGRV